MKRGRLLLLIFFALFTILVFFTGKNSKRTRKLPQNTNTIAPILPNPPIAHRRIVEGTKLNWGNTGAFTSNALNVPELYGSWGTTKVYEWKNGRKGNLESRITEIRSLSGTTMITWGKPTTKSSVHNKEGVVTVECITGAGYYNDNKAAGWETGTIYDYLGNDEMRFVHVWNILSNGDLRMWEALCPNGAQANVSECQSELERVLGATESTATKLKIYMLEAESTNKGVKRL